MTQRNEALATALEHVAGRILTVAEGLSDTAWDVVPPGEARTAGQIAYHTAEVYHNVSGFIQMALGGQPLPPLTMEIIHGFNAEQAARYAGAGREGALEMLRQNGTATAAMLRTLSDAQLDTRTEFLGHPMTVESLAQNGLVGHAEEHLTSIKAAVAST
jgi:DinB superfamily